MKLMLITVRTFLEHFAHTQKNLRKIQVEHTNKCLIALFTFFNEQNKTIMITASKQLT